LLSNRFNTLVSSKDQDACSLLSKTTLEIKIDSVEDFLRLDRLNLCWFEFGLEVKAVHFVPLLKRLKTYPNGRLLNNKYGLTIDWSKPTRATKLIGQVKNSIKKTPLLSTNCLTKLHITNIYEATICSTQIYSVLLNENKESLQDLAIEYKADTLREETTLLADALSSLQKLTALKLRMNRNT